MQRGELLFGDLFRRARNEPRDRVDELKVFADWRERQPEPVVAVPAEARRHDTDDGVRHAVQSQGASDRRWAAFEEAQPQLVTHHYHRVCLAIQSDVGWLDRPAGDRRHAEEVEGAAGHQDTAEALGRKLPGHQHRFVRRRHDVRERRQRGEARKLIECVGVPAAAVGCASLRRPDLVRLRIRIGRDEHAVDDAEDRRRGADPERQRQQRHQHGHRAPSERAERVAQILGQRFKPAAHDISSPAMRD